MSQASRSNYSRGSRRSRGGYRTVAATSEDDPTLYARPKKDPLRAKYKSRITYEGFKKPTEKKAAKGRLSKGKKDNLLTKIRSQVNRGDYSHPDVVVIPASELQRMRNQAVILTKEEQLQKKRIYEEQK